MGREEHRDSALDGFERLQCVRGLFVFQDKDEGGGTVDDESFHASNPAAGVDEGTGRLALAERETRVQCPEAGKDLLAGAGLVGRHQPGDRALVLGDDDFLSAGNKRKQCGERGFGLIGTDGFGSDHIWIF